MKLKPDIIEVLSRHGVEQAQIDQLIDFFTSKAAEADGSVAALTANIESLQKQLQEETARAARTRDGIAKFVVAEEAPGPSTSTKDT